MSNVQSFPLPVSSTRHPLPTDAGGLRRRPDSAGRWLLAAVGVVAVALGGVGVVLPGLPTTIFLIIGSWCFARSCPWLEERLIRVRVFRPFLRYLEPGVRMPLRARIWSMGMMWLAIGVSVWWLYRSEASWWVSVLVALSGVVGTWAIARWRR